MDYYMHPTATVDEGAAVGEKTKIWQNTHVCAKATVGSNCNIGQNVYIDNHTVVGNYCKIQNNVNIYDGVTLEDYVFCGPSMTFTNVKTPRCLYPTDRENYSHTLVKYGASMGAHVTVVCGTTIGRHALIGSGTVICKDVKDYALVVGNPGKQIGWVCECGEKLNEMLVCPKCYKQYEMVENGIHEKGND